MAGVLAGRTRIKMFKTFYCFMILIVILLLFVTFLSYYSLNSLQLFHNNYDINGHHSRQSRDHYLDSLDGHNNYLQSRADNNGDNNGIQIEDTIDLQIKSEDLETRVKELLTIKSSVRNELRQLESRRRDLLREISEFSNKLDVLRTQLAKKTQELDRIQVSLEQTKYDQKEVLLKSNALLAPPLQLLPSLPQTSDISRGVNDETSKRGWHSKSAYSLCRMYNCFDYSRCSLFSPFLLYFYHPEDDDIDDTKDTKEMLDSFRHHDQQPPTRKLLDPYQRLRSHILDSFNDNLHVTFDPTVACVYVVILMNDRNQVLTKDYLNIYLNSLPYWAGDGRNHLVINMFRDLDLHSIEGLDLKKSILIQTNFKSQDFRPGYDIVLPQIHENMLFITERSSPADSTIRMCPARRKYLATYLGPIDSNNSIQNQIKTTLLKLSTHLSNNNELLFDFVCDDKTRRLCDNQTLVLRQSTFALILPPIDTEVIFNTNISLSLINSLSSGSIPVIIGGDYLRLPFDEVIDWRLAAIHLPIARITELHFLLRSYSDADILELRRYGQLFLNRHLSSIQAIIDTILALIRQSRLQIPSAGAREEPSESVFNTTNPMKFFDATSGLVLVDTTGDNEENLGPIEPPFSSVSYQRNYSLVITNGYKLWNDYRFDPFTTYPSLPFDPILASDAKHIGSSYGFRPIGGGTGGAGKEFSEALGGNVPKEQFTVVMLTYEREAVLIDSLQRLKGLPYLNKVLVIWNSARQPSADLRWPELGAPIHVIRAKRNSLNNRFMPYADIETDAVLSMDDDAHLRHDEIIFGFRVWREARDRIVGFPGRYHAWDESFGSFLYNSNYSCELSMVLTGAAFFHKYYNYLYTYSMPKAIRDTVDDYMNCEDIAMNFLVSHISRQPPIKVTSRWTFRCPGCPISLSEDDSHFNERHKCINYFFQIYGYMPLLNTQFRADSVLFKTRIPHDKQKCFKFI